MTFQKVPISSFLAERESRIKPAEANKMGLKRLNKINFSGEIYLSDKNTNTDMILVKNGDLVISGINVEKGAVAVYQGKEDIIATIHYSAYIYDKDKIDLEYLKIFLMSSAFKEAINSQTRGGIKTEIKPKTFLKLEIYLPDLKTQIEIRNKLKNKIVQVNDYSEVQEKNESLIAKLRQSILQSAVQGKLVKQDLKDESVSELLKKIKAEKEKLIKEGKIRKDKPLAPISEDEAPFILPKGWEWVRLGEIFENCEYGTSEKCSDFGDVPVFSMGNIQDGKVTTINLKCLSNKSEDLPKLYLKNKDLLFNRTNSYELVGKTGIFYGKDDKFSFASYLIRLRIFKQVSPEYVNYYLLSKIFRETQIEPEIVQQCGQANFNGTKLKSTLFPLPPLDEQKRIVEKVDKLMACCDELEKQVKENQENAEKLMSAVLEEGFEE